MGWRLPVLRPCCCGLRVIDIHFHCLPGIDDGPADWAGAVDLCRAAAADGVKKIVATPHVLRDPWLNEDRIERERLIEELNSRLGGSPAVLPGCEFWFVSDLIELVERGEDGPVVTLNGSRYLLVEFAPGFVPKNAAAIFHELAVMGFVPLIAHPERNLVFARDPGQLMALAAQGARVQITAASILGEAGKSAFKACEQFFRLDLIHVVASDAHDIVRRPPRLRAARERVRRLWGKDAEEGLFVNNPRAIIENKPLP